MQRVRQRRGKLTKAKPDLAKEKAALHRVLGEPVIQLEARPPGVQEILSRGGAVEQLRDRLDRLSGESGGRPCPVDPSKCLHQLRVDEDILYFPFEPLAPQKAVASYSIKACDRGGIAFLESPTGTGKSLALLCAVLAWQRRQAEKVTTVPQIVYGVRTHSQIKQIVGELRKCGYRPRMAVIGSRDQLCANETVKSEARRGRVSLNLSCRQAARCAVANLPGGCNLYRGLGQNSYAQRVHDRYGQAGRIWDVEELLSCAQPKASDQFPGCPYYTAHVLAGDADIVFCPQNYILDPSVSQCRSHHRERWSLKGRIVIIDAPGQCGDGGP
ncbi:unnamed protein product [Cladocopium goreaui]|uniref:Helicase ATP-binding domain-containing protein n=1 Tax=Cladocopium goreaui TaxID=2562237 RepID=A0A9P1GNL4_9DINO|nr:unnamed protein product [Cladocopium goreaui]